MAGLSYPDPKNPRTIHGLLVVKGNSMRLMDPERAMAEQGITSHQIRFTSTVMLDDNGPSSRTADKIYQLIRSNLKELKVQLLGDGSISVESVLIKVAGCDDDESKSVLVSWGHQDEDLGSHLLRLVQDLA